MQYMITAVGGSTLNTIISLGVALAIFNATLAIILSVSRILFSSGRDRAWPEPISTWLATLHPRLRTPWLATAFVGLVGAILTGVSSLAALVTFTGVILVVIYALIALSALVSRIRQKGLFRPYRMPLWPVPPLVALAGLVVVATQQTLHDVGIVAAFVVAALIYYVIYLRGRQDTRWVMLEPTTAEKEALAQPNAGPAGQL
jgi:amino acid transporter